MISGEIKTGDWEWHQVEATLDKGIQTVYRLETQSGKWIETTSEHPYLVKNSHQKTASNETVSSGLTRFANNNEPNLRTDINISENEEFVKSPNEIGVDPTGIEPVRPIFLGSAPEPGGPTQGLLSQNPNLFSIKWVKVSQLQKGMEIATADGWEKIISISKVGRKLTYDLQIEGTHNFVGNNIVAHNTYINGNLGLGIASPATNLHLLGSGTGTGVQLLTQNNTQTNFGLAVLDNGNVGVGITAPTGVFQVGSSATAPVLFASSSTGNVGIGTASPTSLLHVLGSQPASVGTTPGTAATTALTVTGGTGGNTTAGGTAVGGVGAGAVLTGGTGGGVPSGASQDRTGGAGGQLTLTGGAGGSISSLINTSTGGAGGSLVLTGGAGGSGSGSGNPTNTGGAGGSLELIGGQGGA
ncbi:hypothetical protein HYW41_02850, partial [Candidatus Daviesbacteria bacterium]|nr:hypothetical protein [Candidatus Daviesbacteria bacterium]